MSVIVISCPGIIHEMVWFTNTQKETESIRISTSNSGSVHSSGTLSWSTVSLITSGNRWCIQTAYGGTTWSPTPRGRPGVNGTKTTVWTAFSSMKITVLISISQEVVLKGSTDNKSTIVRIMAPSQIVDKPSAKPFTDPAHWRIHILAGFSVLSNFEDYFQLISAQLVKLLSVNHILPPRLWEYWENVTPSALTRSGQNLNEKYIRSTHKGWCWIELYSGWGVFTQKNAQGCLCLYGLTEFGEQISNYIQFFMWNVIIHPCLNFNSYLTKPPLK